MKNKANDMTITDIKVSIQGNNSKGECLFAFQVSDYMTKKEYKALLEKAALSFYNDSKFFFHVSEELTKTMEEV